MREILFRGKRTDGGGWVRGSYIECKMSWYRLHPHKAWIITDARSNGGWFAITGRYPVVNDTVGQYTGLKDKADRMIFEGDILRWEFEDGEPEIAEVTWRDDGPEGVGWYIRSIRPFPGLDILCSGDSEWEVIGNIYDNPELLEEKPHETN